MPGPEPAGTTPPPPLPDPTVGDVIRLGDRRAARHERQEPTVGAAYGQPSDPTPEELLAQTIQALYLKRQRSLADPETAEAYDIALQAMLLMLDGAMVRAGLPEEHHRTLRGMVEAARQVPNIL
ncbi:hypothetical protein [Streptomyces asiaticus]|uniref:hypothetical protein n=1 Tax=Streptomyces asiaticus TaxID=114695 RepID=UPI0037FCE983